MRERGERGWGPASVQNDRRAGVGPRARSKNDDSDDRDYWRQRSLRHGRADRPGREEDHDTLRRALWSVRPRDVARQARGVPAAARGRPPHSAVRAELPRQHLRNEGARRRAHPVGKRGGQPQTRIQTARHRCARSIFRSTKGRISTFFGRGLVAHVAFAHPVCADLSKVAADSAESVGATVHRGGTYVNMEGPQFSTLAESKLYRSWGMDVIGMTNLQEAKLAREAEICYATLALVTDYDCWHPDHHSVTADLIISNLLRTAKTAQHAIAEAVGRIDGPRTCPCATALATAIITQPQFVPEQIKKELAPIIGKYMK